MAHGCIEFNSASQCPICGHSLWCCLSPITSAPGMYYVTCKRDFSMEDKVGYDGQLYVYLGETDSGNSRYEERTQREQRLNGNSINRNWKQSDFQKREIIKKDEVKPRDNVYLDKIYRYMLSIMYLDKMHEDYLLKEKWSRELMDKNLVRSFPENDYIRHKYNNSFSRNSYRKTIATKVIEHFKHEYGKDCLKGVPGAYKNKKGEWTFAGPKGIIFPMYDANGYLYRLRIRMDFMDVEQKLVQKRNAIPYFEVNEERYFVEPMKGVYRIIAGEKVFDNTKAFRSKKKGKYRTLASYHRNEKMYEKGIDVNDYDSGCASENLPGIYMDPLHDDMFVCFITEGEKKGIFCNDLIHAPFISIPGVDSWSKLIAGEKGQRVIDILKKLKVGIFVIAYDADKKENTAVMKNQMQIVKAIQAEGIAVCTAEWDMLLGKGIDDLLAAGHHPNYSIV